MSELLAMRRADGLTISPLIPVPYRTRSEARGEHQGAEPHVGIITEVPFEFACLCDACLNSRRIITSEESSLEGDRLLYSRNRGRIACSAPLID